MYDIETKHGYIFQMSLNDVMEQTIYYNIYDTVYGRMLIASTEIGLCFVALGEETFMIDELRNEYAKAKLVKENKSIHLDTILLIENPLADINIPFHIKGTDFQMKVWEELLKIPAGGKSSYKIIAKNIGRPKAVRAVGTAVGQNPISCLIPCHRVIRSDNTLGGYHWGFEIKKKILERESLNFNQ
ncbi:MAG: methylated-DNA--[protein]-cysteine S-methyltransferase [Fermentimonas sp.]|nr:methylated-DNA--[protein]-cysteine S-methyltransferase [Fermentimonas sp.]